MRVPISEDRAKLLDVFFPYLYCPKGKTGMYIKDDAPATAKQAFEDYLKIKPIDNND